MSLDGFPGGMNRANPAPLTGLNTLRLGRFLGLKPQAVCLRRSAAKTIRGKYGCQDPGNHKGVRAEAARVTTKVSGTECGIRTKVKV